MIIDATAVRVALITSGMGTFLRLSSEANVQRTRLSLIVNGHVEAREDERQRIALALGGSIEQFFPPGRHRDAARPEARPGRVSSSGATGRLARVP